MTKIYLKLGINVVVVVKECSTLNNFHLEYHHERIAKAEAAASHQLLIAEAKAWKATQPGLKQNFANWLKPHKISSSTEKLHSN
jgi:hypothetical protein